MPKGTKVWRCVQKCKAEQRKPGAKKVNCYAVCQASTGQSYKTGRKPKSRKKSWYKRQYKKSKG